MKADQGQAEDSGFFPGEPAERLGLRLLWLPTWLDPWETIARWRGRRMDRALGRDIPVWMDKRYLRQPPSMSLEIGLRMSEDARRMDHGREKR